MKKINNLLYTLKISYKNDSGVKTTISVKFNDNGLKIKTVKVGNVSITEETIKGRVLSGRFDNVDVFCGYKYDYKHGEKLLNINPNISIERSISLISKTKKERNFLSAEFVLSSILRNDYRVVTLDNGSLEITKIVSAKNEQSQHCVLQEKIGLVKLDGDESFVEQDKKRIYKLDDKCVVEENKILINSDITSQLNELSAILIQNPQNYKELIEIKNQIIQNSINNSINREKTL